MCLVVAFLKLIFVYTTLRLYRSFSKNSFKLLNFPLGPHFLDVLFIAFSFAKFLVESFWRIYIICAFGLDENKAFITCITYILFDSGAYICFSVLKFKI